MQGDEWGQLMLVMKFKIEELSFQNWADYTPTL